MRACLLKPPFVGGFRRWLEPVFRQLADRSADAAGYGIRAMAPAACSLGLGLNPGPRLGLGVGTSHIGPRPGKYIRGGGSAREVTTSQRYEVLLTKFIKFTKYEVRRRRSPQDLTRRWIGELSLRSTKKTKFSGSDTPLVRAWGLGPGARGMRPAAWGLGLGFGLDTKPQAGAWGWDESH